MRNRPLILAIDFDGTITDYSGKYPNCGRLRNGMSEFLRILRSYGVFLILWTCRSGYDLDLALDFLHDNNIIVDAINRDYLENHTDEPSRKIFADIYWDDHSVDGRSSYLSVANKVIEVNPFKNDEESSKFMYDINSFLVSINYELPV
jgi:hypothetical protein